MNIPPRSDNISPPCTTTAAMCESTDLYQQMLIRHNQPQYGQYPLTPSSNRITINEYDLVTPAQAQPITVLTKEMKVQNKDRKLSILNAINNTAQTTNNNNTNNNTAAAAMNNSFPAPTIVHNNNNSSSPGGGFQLQVNELDFDLKLNFDDAAGGTGTGTAGADSSSSEDDENESNWEIYSEEEFRNVKDEYYSNGSAVDNNNNNNSIIDYDSLPVDDERKYRFDIGQLIKPCTGLYLGSRDAAENRHWLESVGITHILTVGSRMPPCFIDKFIYHCIDAEDDSQQNLAQHFNTAFTFIDTALNQNNQNNSVLVKPNKVLVHCLAGISRSTTIVCSYLMRFNHCDVSTALLQIQNARPWIQPNTGFMRQLNAYSEHLQQEWASSNSMQ